MSPPNGSANDDDAALFSDDEGESPLDSGRASSAQPVAQGSGTYTILVVDDDEGVHQVTRLALAALEVDGRGLALIHAFSGREARAILSSTPDVAVVLLDVVMETEHAGLDLVDWIRGELGNTLVRVALRTGQPGTAPEATIMSRYDVNDYYSKTELTSQRLRTAVTGSVRAFRDLRTMALERTVEARTVELDARNREMRSLLNAMRQGFLSIDESGTPSHERSAAVDTWFGPPRPNETWFEMLERCSPTFARATRIAWDEVILGIMPDEVTIAQMPSRLVLGVQHLEVEYQAFATPSGRRFLVVIDDVTVDVQRDQSERASLERIAIFERVVSDASFVESFLVETSKLVETVADRSIDDFGRRRALHTLKGNAALFGLATLASLSDAIEDRVLEIGSDAFSPTNLRALIDEWNERADEMRRVLGQRTDVVEVEREHHRAIEHALVQQRGYDEIVSLVRALPLESVRRRLTSLGQEAQRLAARLGKPPLRIRIDEPGIRVGGERWAGLWNALVHVVRNAVDHGIELEDERISAGKEATGALVLRAKADHDSVFIEVEDDGRGIDWRAVRDRAADLGLLVADEASLQGALFADGLSTRDEASATSGRGMGMSALSAAVHALGGSVRVTSTAACGTTVTIAMPRSDDVSTAFATSF
jgi:two-component system chemotaxis sensor kinase CheA